MAKFNILYASEMGNAIGIADNTFLFASKQGIEAEQFELNDVSMVDLANMKKILIITSSIGDGDLPIMGDDFWDALSSQISIQKVLITVYALGTINLTSISVELVEKLTLVWPNWVPIVFLKGRIVTVTLSAQTSGLNQQLKNLAIRHSTILIFGK